MPLIFVENELIINVKRGKTESMLFGTAKRLSTIKTHLEIDYKSSPITFVKKYKYLGYIVDNNLLLLRISIIRTKELVVD